MPAARGSHLLRTMLLIGLACVSGALAGCESDTLPTYPVRGQVLSGGTPAENAFVVFHPQGNDERLQRLRPTGRVGSDGYFALTTYLSDDGAPQGDYVVTVEWPGRDPSIPVAATDSEAALSGPDRLQGRYQDPATSGLTATIAAGANELPPIEVQLPSR